MFEIFLFKNGGEDEDDYDKAYEDNKNLIIIKMKDDGWSSNKLKIGSQLLGKIQLRIWY